ncbi:MAG: hypothetical protein PHW82_17395 [Bacteroidales bacterium]|nr:hypothetical protein [Bacteroidales bacterium]
MRRLNLFCCLFLIILITNSCTLDKKLNIPENSVVITKEDTIFNEKNLKSYLSSKNKSILLFADTECSFCEIEINNLLISLKKYSELVPVLILNSSYPEIYLLRAMKNKSFSPTVMYKKFDMITQNNLSPKTKYIIVDNKLNILSKSKTVDDIKIKRLLKK